MNLVPWFLAGAAGAYLLLRPKSAAVSTSLAAIPPAPIPSPKPGSPVNQPPPISAPNSGDLPDIPAGMTGSQFAALLPENNLPRRDAIILKAVREGAALPEWQTIPTSANGHSGEILVMTRALRIGVPGDALRVTTNYRTAQEIARLFGGHMLTRRVADLIHANAQKVLPPPTRPWSQDGTMSLTSRMVQNGQILDSLVPKGLDAGLWSNEGKDWIVSARFWNDPSSQKRHNSANYGFYQSAAGNPIQTIGLTHDMSHTDYSQMLRFMGPTMMVDGSQVRSEDVVRDPELSALLSDEGPLPGLVHPDLVSIS